MIGRITSTVVSLRSERPLPYYLHNHQLVDLFADVFGSQVVQLVGPTNPLHKKWFMSGRKLDVARRFPGRAHLVGNLEAVRTSDVLFVMAHDMGDLDLLFEATDDWSSSSAVKVLLLGEVWENDAVQHPETFRRVLPHFDAVFCMLAPGVEALRAATGVDVHGILPTIDVLRTPWADEASIDAVNFGRRSASQHDALLAWADATGGWYHCDTSPLGAVPDVDLHRRIMSQFIAKSAVTICNFARFDQPHRSGDTRATGTRFAETLAGGSAMLGAMPVDGIFRDHFADLRGVTDWSLEPTGPSADLIAEAIRIGRDPSVRREHRQRALDRLDLAHRLVDMLQVIDVARPPALDERLARLAAQHAEIGDLPAAGIPTLRH